MNTTHRTTDLNEIYDALSRVANESPESNLQLVAVELGADRAYWLRDILQVIMPDGSGFAFDHYAETQSIRLSQTNSTYNSAPQPMSAIF